MLMAISVLTLLLLLTSAVQAEAVYKSVGADGRVTYSSTPPEDSKDVTKIDIQPAPSQDRIDDAQQRHERNVRAAELLDQNRKKRNEILAEQNRQKQEKQDQLQKKTEQKEPDNINVYPYYLPRYPGLTVPPYKPGMGRPGPGHPEPGRHANDHPRNDRPVIHHPPAERPQQPPIPWP